MQWDEPSDAANGEIGSSESQHDDRAIDQERPVRAALEKGILFVRIT